MDIVAISFDDQWVQNARLDPESHWVAFGQLSADSFPLLMRLNDYYGDALFSPNELAQVINELDELAPTVENTVEWGAFESVRAVFETAKLKGLRVEALAD